MTTATTAQLQQDGTHNPHKEHPGASGTGDAGDCTTRPHRTNLPNTQTHMQRSSQNEESNMSLVKKKKKGKKKLQKKNTTKLEASNLPDAEFKSLFIRMLNELRGRIYGFSENINKEIENIKIEIEKRIN